MKKQKPLSPPLAIAFDWDGTIVDSFSATVESVEKVLASSQINPHDIQQKYNGNKTLQENFDDFFGDEAKEAYELFCSYYASLAKDRVTLLPHAKEMFEFLAQTSIPVAIVSNKEHEHLLIEMEALLPTISFHEIVGGNDIPKRKPSGDPLRYAFRNSSIPLSPENVWMVGDSQFDIECAYDATCLPIFIGQGDHCIDKSFMGEYLAKQKRERDLMHLKDLGDFLSILRTIF